MAPVLDYPAVLHDPDAVHDALGFCVQGACGLVEQEDRRVLEDRPGDGNPLLLAARELNPALAHGGFVPVGKIDMPELNVAPDCLHGICIGIIGVNPGVTIKNGEHGSNCFTSPDNLRGQTDSFCNRIRCHHEHHEDLDDLRECGQSFGDEMNAIP
nr:unknown [Ipomoea trifida]